MPSFLPPLAVGPKSAITRPLTGQDYKTLALAALGGALEFYDFIIFVFFAKVIGQLFFPASVPDWLRLLQTFGIFAAGYLARPLGGIIMGVVESLVASQYPQWKDAVAFLLLIGILIWRPTGLLGKSAVEKV